MNSFWRFLRDKRNQQVLGWLGGGLVVAATGLWGVFVYFFPSESPETKASHTDPANVQADCSGVAIGGNVIRRDHHDGCPNQFGLRVQTEIRCQP